MASAHKYNIFQVYLYAMLYYFVVLSAEVHVPFSEETKRIARSKAHHRCVICQIEPFLDVHHIVPESEGGPDDLDNAAPLCAGCHDKYGNDPNKRKQIKEMREDWYRICEAKFKDPDVQLIVLDTGQIIDDIGKLKYSTPDNPQVNKEIQSHLMRIYTIAQNRFSVPGLNHDDIATMSGYVATASTAASAVPGQGFCRFCGNLVNHADKFCFHCGSALS
jgi:hypothetical protein